MLRRLAFGALRATLIPLLLRNVAQRRRVTILCYHAPLPAVFGGHLRALAERYTIVPLSEFIRARKRGTTAQLPPKPLVLTLDDGHRTNHALKAVIDAAKTPITIFLCSGIVGTRRRFWFLHPPANRMVQSLKRLDDRERLERLRAVGFDQTTEYDARQALSDAEIADLQSNAEFQSHGIFHPVLPQCGSEKACAEIADSKRDLESRLGAPIYAFAYPNGSYSQRDARMVEQAGYSCALTLDRGSNDERTPLFRLKRIPIPDDASVDEVVVKASGLWAAIEEWRHWFRPRRDRDSSSNHPAIASDRLRAVKHATTSRT
jgi:peptidoglycan/xylan/chitin deacetylase (PgdA/CDA1 family)